NRPGRTEVVLERELLLDLPDGNRGRTLHHWRQDENGRWERLRRRRAPTAVQDELSILMQHFQPVPRELDHPINTSALRLRSPQSTSTRPTRRSTYSGWRTIP